MAVLTSRAALLARVTLLPRADALLAEHRRELPQRDELCGPFGALLALRSMGSGVAGHEVDQDAVAVAAGTVLSPPRRAGSLPPGEPGRSDFRLVLPDAVDAAGAGTSAHGVAAAVSRLSHGALVAVPASGRWHAGAVRDVLERVTAVSVVAVLANVATGEFWDPSADPAALARYLDSGVEDVPRQRWRVGHFVTLAGMLAGPGGTLVLVADTYRSLGADGLHLQPVPRVAAALRREGSPPGGLLLVVRAEHRDAAEDVVRSCGLHPELWDNGSPVPH